MAFTTPERRLTSSRELALAWAPQLVSTLHTYRPRSVMEDDLKEKIRYIYICMYDMYKIQDTHIDLMSILSPMTETLLAPRSLPTFSQVMLSAGPAPRHTREVSDP